MSKINQPEIHIAQHTAVGPTVRLGETTSEDLAALWPVAPATIANMTAHDQGLFLGSTPQQFFDPYDRWPECMMWGVNVAEVNQKEALIGVVSLAPVTGSRQEIGIALLSPEHQGRGIGRLAIAGLATFAFEGLNAGHVVVSHLLSNEAMCRIADRLGFTKTMKDRSDVDGRQRGTWVLPRPSPNIPNLKFARQQADLAISLDYEA